MSWSGKTKARRFAAPGEIAALFASCKAMSSDSPLGQAFLNALGSLVGDSLAKTPHDGDITVETYGHVSPDGFTGDFTLRFTFGPHVMPQPVAPTPPAETSVANAVGLTTPDIPAPPAP